MTTRKQLLGFWPDVLGIGALVLPFTYDISPLEFLLEGISTSWQIWLLAAALVLAIPIAAWQALRIVHSMPTRKEQALAYALSTGATLAPLVVIVSWVGDLLSGGEPSTDSFPLEVFLTAWVCILIVASALLLRFNLKTDAPAEVSAGVFLVGGHLPSATFLLVAFSGTWPFSGWDIGAYLVLAACIGYVLRIVSLMRHGSKIHRTVEYSHVPR